MTQDPGHPAQADDARADGDPAPDLALDPSNLDDPSTDETDAADGEEALEEVERGGRKYRVPRAIVGELMMQADYTRKTQELAAQRQAFEADAARHVQATQQNIAEVARLVALEEQLDGFRQVNWPQLRQQDAGRAQDLWMRYQETKDARDRLAGSMQQRAEAQSFEQAAEQAQLTDACWSSLERDIKGWNHDMAERLGDFGQKTFGFSREELSGVVDPRMIKVLHLAFLGHQAQQAETAGRRAAQAEGARPATAVGASARAGKNPDRMSTEEWMAFERERVRKRR